MSLFKKKLLLILGSIFFALVLFVAGYEIIARIAYAKWRKEFVTNWMEKVTRPSDNKKLMWEYKPYGMIYNTRVTYRLNRYGYRDFDYKVRERPEGVYRIAFAGDSVTLGFAVTDEVTFVRQYNNFANQKYPKMKIQAMNFAVDGYNTLHVLEMIKTRVLPFEPNKVVYVFCLNDFILDSASGYKTEYFDPPVSFFWKKLETAYYEYSGIEYHQFYYNRNRDTVFDAILEMKDALEKAKVGFYVVVMPVLPAGKFAGGTFANYSLTGMHREIGAFLQENHIAYHDLLDAFLKNTNPPKNFQGDIWHPNPDGHRMIAEELTASIPIP